MAIKEPTDLFLKELGEAMYAETKLLEVLPRMAKESEDRTLREGLERHARETEGQLHALERVFDELDEAAVATPFAGLDGLVKDLDAFLKRAPEGHVRDLFLAGAALRAEHIEIATYTSLVTHAELMGEERILELLRKNLDQEVRMAERARALERRLAGAALAEEEEGSLA
jgi:ferritin-like metal-binding protein YciE